MVFGTAVRVGCGTSLKTRADTAEYQQQGGKSDTFHSVGARLLRRFAERVGLATTFTIHDRTDAEDLMGLARQDVLNERTTKCRFPAAATCLAIYSRAVNCQSSLQDVVRDQFPWCAHLEEQLAATERRLIQTLSAVAPY